MTAEIIKKIRVGDPLSDLELEEAIEFYGRMESGLSLLGTHYYLAWIEVQRVYDALRGYRRYRDREKEGSESK
jgi:hypothetical protein